MRVPSVGLKLDERRIIREGYQLAESMLRDYVDPPRGFAAVPGLLFAALDQTMRGLYRVIARN